MTMLIITLNIQTTLAFISSNGKK